MKRRVVSMALALAMALGLAAPAMAYQTPDFSDLPSDNWAYGPVMRMADQGYIQGTGEGKFSPTMKVSVAQFLTLVGRIVFPETVVGANDTWYGPYVAAVQEAGLLTGTQVDVNQPEAEISRYDMAVVLRAAAKKLGKAEVLAQQSQVTDYGTVPAMYGDAVLAVYGMGLITGDQNGSFNGANTMMRNELAAVIDRLVALKTPGGSTTESEKPTESERPVAPEKPSDPNIKFSYLGEAGCEPRRDYDPQSVELKQGKDLWIDGGFLTPEAKASPYSTYVYFHVGDTYQFAISEVPAGYDYTQADVQWSSDNEKVFTVDSNGCVTVVGPGSAYLRASIPVIYYRNIWTTKEDAIALCVDP